MTTHYDYPVTGLVVWEHLTVVNGFADDAVQGLDGRVYITLRIS
jgi:hypothetical protein